MNRDDDDAPLNRLDSLAPLVSLLAMIEDPWATCDVLLESARPGNACELPESVPDAEAGLACLEEAGIVDAEGRYSGIARDRLVEARLLLAVRHAPADRWRPVLTVPPFLRERMPRGTVLETRQVLRRLITRARSRLLVAAPFFDEGLGGLVPAIANAVRGGIECLVLTRDLRNAGRSGRNRLVIARLRALSQDEPGLDVVSWEQPNLGIHMKVVIRDSAAAYVGSANLTWGGLADHGEMGVLLEGPRVRELERLMDAVADGMRAQQRPGRT